MININGKKWEKLRLNDIKKYLIEIDNEETFL